MSGTTLLGGKLLEGKSRPPESRIQGFHELIPVYLSTFLSCHSCLLYLDMMFFSSLESIFSHFYLAKFLSHFERPTLMLPLRQWQCHENLGFPQSPSATLLNTVSGQDHWAFCPIPSHPASLSLSREECQNDDHFQVPLLCFQGWLSLHLCFHSSLHMPPFQHHHIMF